MTGFGSASADDEAALGLAVVCQSGCHSLLRFVGREGAEAVWRSSRRRLLAWGVAPSVVERFDEKRRGFIAADIQELLARSELHFLPYGSAHYPQELGHLDYPPAGLFARATEGALERLCRVPRVTIVGTRKATPYGLRAAERFAGAFATAGVAVVSGMALGIDGQAHEAALQAGGLTVAILGCGVDVVYPRRHAGLYRRIARDGIVLSELPPGSIPARWTFPQRNRLLAVLGDASLVVEGSRTSGAMQTAGWALELGRPVFAVPGQIAVESHEGCNWLLYDGAGPALDPCVTVEDFLLQTRIERKGRRETAGDSGADAGGDAHFGRGGTARLGTSEARLAAHGGLARVCWRVTESCAESILEALQQDACSVDRLVGHTGHATREVMAALAELELIGLVTRGGPGLYVRAP